MYWPPLCRPQIGGSFSCCPLVFLWTLKVFGSSFRPPQKGPENWRRTKIVEKWRKIVWHFLTFLTFPWPSNPCFFEKSKGKPRKKARFFLFAEPLQSLEKEGETHKKARQIGKRKKARKSKKARIGGSGFLPCAKNVEKCRKYFWHFLTIFDVFDVAPFRQPLLRSADS